MGGVIIQVRINETIGKVPLAVHLTDNLVDSLSDCLGDLLVVAIEVLWHIRRRLSTRVIHEIHEIVLCLIQNSQTKLFPILRTLKNFVHLCVIESID